MISSLTGKRQETWWRIKQVKSGVSMYKATLVNGHLVWEWSGVEKGVKVEFYERNYDFLDYTPGVHDDMIVHEMRSIPIGGTTR